MVGMWRIRFLHYSSTLYAVQCQPTTSLACKFMSQASASADKLATTSHTVQQPQQYHAAETHSPRPRGCATHAPGKPPPLKMEPVNANPCNKLCCQVLQSRSSMATVPGMRMALANVHAILNTLPDRDG